MLPSIKKVLKLLLLLLLRYELHWLPLKQHIHFKIMLFAFKATHAIEPTYIQNLVSWKSQGPSRWLHQSYGMLYRASLTLEGWIRPGGKTCGVGRGLF